MKQRSNGDLIVVLPCFVAGYFRERVCLFEELCSEGSHSLSYYVVSLDYCGVEEIKLHTNLHRSEYQSITL